MRGERRAKAIIRKSATRADVHGPAVDARLVEPRLVRRDRETEVGAGDPPGPCRPDRECIDRNRGPSRIGAVERLRHVAETDSSVDHADLPQTTSRHTN